MSTGSGQPTVAELPHVSVIVPTRDRPGPLARCLEALGALEYPRDRLQVLVVDDGSTPPVDEAVARSRGDLDVRLLRTPGEGAAVARSIACRHARGEVVAFTDDDCRPARDWLARLALRLTREPDVLVGGRTLNALRDNPYAEASQVVQEMVYAFYDADPCDAAFVASNNLAVRRDRLLEAGCFDGAAGWPASEDRELCDRWRHRGGRIVVEPEALVRHEHRMGLGGYLRQHFGYGRGAWHYHRARAARGSGRLRSDVRFHLSSRAWAVGLEAIRRRGGPRLAVLLVLWQLANAAGFAWAGATSLLGSPSRSIARTTPRAGRERRGSSTRARTRSD